MKNISLSTVALVQRAKALAEIKTEVQSLLPPGVSLLNVRDGIWVLGCVPFLRTRIRFMVPEIEKSLSAFSQRAVKVEVRSYLPEVPLPTPQRKPFVLSPLSLETMAQMRVVAGRIEDERIRGTLLGIVEYSTTQSLS